MAIKNSKYTLRGILLFSLLNKRSTEVDNTDKKAVMLMQFQRRHLLAIAKLPVKVEQRH